MRKLINILVAFLLFVGTIGPSLNMHFCSNKLVSFSFFNKPKKCCGGTCKKCKDVTAFYKIKEHFVKQEIHVKAPILPKPEIVLVPPFTSFNSELLTINSEIIIPPPLIKHLFVISITILRI